MTHAALDRRVQRVNSDATVFGQFVILAGLVITALTQISLALINRREVATKADALATTVKTTATQLAAENARQQRITEDLVRRSNEETRAEAQRAYKEANDVNTKLAKVTAALDARFDALVEKKIDRKVDGK